MSAVENIDATEAASVEDPGPATATRAAAAGAALTAALVVTVMVVGGEVIPGLVVTGALFVGLAVGLLRSRARWLLVLAVALPVVALVTSIPFIVSDLSHPESAGGFVPQLLLSLTASFTALSAGAALGGRGRLVPPAAAAFAVVGLVGSAIDGTDVDQEMPGSTARRLAVDLEPGTYRFYCDVPGHDAMEGTLVVD